MSVTRWLALVCTVVTLSSTTGCNAILGDFSSGNGDGGTGVVQDGSGLPGNGQDANGTVDGNPPPNDDANSGPDSPGNVPDTGGDTSITCGPNQKECSGVCVDSTVVANSCATPGLCGPCSLPNAVTSPQCNGGACAILSCLNNYQDCNGAAADGCEVHLVNDPLHCGGCNNVCNATNGKPICAGGQCTDIVCDPGFADCNNKESDGCETSITTATNCGTCGYVCGTANGTPSCVSEASDAGADAGTAEVCSFACTAPYAHCPTSADSAGCDIDTNTDNNNCGGCGKQCALGQKCSNGSCACNASTCPSGCCDPVSGGCVTSSPTACGSAGSACVNCATNNLDCTAAGTCVCDAKSCPNGCCNSAGACVTTSADVSCGKGGAACTDCTKTSLACSADGTQCQCTQTSCAGGCCSSGTTCVPVGASQNTSQCGSGGNACGKCAAGQACSGGACECGGGACNGCCASGACVTQDGGAGQCGANGGVCAACGANQECNTQGECVCDANTCPNGCCTATVGGTCITTELAAACGSGGALCATCVSGSQECAKSPVTSQYSCTCDATSCKNGCCNGNTCVPYSGEGPTECGTAGAQCSPCGQGTYCNAGGVCTCDSTKCTGCCTATANGTCLASADTSCGINGAACVGCTVPGQKCNAAGQCQCDLNSCGSGCCTALIGGTCLSGKTNPACGTGGALCSTCKTGSGTDCNGVQCVCDSSCPGCCNGNTCEPGNVFGQCGSGGAGCNPCVNGQHCATSGTTNSCVCDNTSCTAGCCTATANGACTAYTSEGTLCGAAGAICAPCPSGQACNTANGTCGCTAASCSGGCCDVGGCETSGNTTCGTSGAACQNCTTSGVSCVSGACQQVLTVTVSGSGTGTVSSNVAGITNCASNCSAPYTYGTAVTLTPTPGPGSTFAGWAGACTGIGGCTVSMNAAESVTATFTIQQFALTVSPAGNGGGTVVSAPSGINCGVTTCTGSFNYGTNVTLTASPTAQSTFTGWGAPCSGTGTCTIDVTAASSVTATFTLNQYALTVAAGGNGSGTVTTTGNIIDCVASGGAASGTCSAKYDYNTSVTLTAAASTGSSFTGFTGGGCSGAGTTCVVAMTAAMNVTATFTLQQFALKVTDIGSGSGTTILSSTAGNNSCGSGCSINFNYGTQVTVTPTAATGSSFAGFSGACSGAACTVTVSSALIVNVTFNAIPETLTVNPSPYGTVTSVPAGINCGATCSAPFNYGSTATLTAVPGGGYALTGWTDAACTGSTCALVMTAAQTVSPIFTPTAVVWDPGWSPTITYASNNLTITGATVGADTNARTNFPLTPGNWYWEVTVNAGGPPPANNGGLGISGAGFPPTNCYYPGYNSTGVNGSTCLNVANGLSFGYGCCASWWPNWPGIAEPAGAPPATSEVTAGNIYTFAVNTVAGTMWVGNNGTWYNAGAPSTQAAPAITGLTSPIYPDVVFYSGSPDSYTANFGSAPFKEPVPTGFTPGINNYGFPDGPCNFGSPFTANFLLGEVITIPAAVHLAAFGMTNSLGNGGNGQMALYAGGGGSPGALLAQTAQFAVQTGTNIIPITPVSIAAGTYYIMGVYSVAPTMCETAGTAGAYTYGAAGLTFGSPLPNPFGAATTTASNIFQYWIFATP